MRSSQKARAGGNFDRTGQNQLTNLVEDGSLERKGHGGGGGSYMYRLPVAKNDTPAVV